MGVSIGGDIPFDSLKQVLKMPVVGLRQAQLDLQTLIVNSGLELHPLSILRKKKVPSTYGMEVVAEDEQADPDSSTITPGGLPTQTPKMTKGKTTPGVEATPSKSVDKATPNLDKVAAKSSLKINLKS